MTCDQALRLVINSDVSVVDINSLQSAREHILRCPHCSSRADAVDDEVSEESGRHPLSAMVHNRAVVGTRLALWLVGLAQLLIALPWIFGATPLWDPTTSAAESHLTRDGVIGVLFALVAIAVAVSPRLAFFAVPACVVLLVLQVVTLIVDQQTDLVHVQFESIHLLTLAITVLVLLAMAVPRWVLRRNREQEMPSRNATEKKTLRSVR